MNFFNNSSLIFHVGSCYNSTSFPTMTSHYCVTSTCPVSQNPSIPKLAASHCKVLTKCCKTPYSTHYFISRLLLPTVCTCTIVSLYHSLLLIFSFVAPGRRGVLEADAHAAPGGSTGAPRRAQAHGEGEDPGAGP